MVSYFMKYPRMEIAKKNNYFNGADDHPKKDDAIKKFPVQPIGLIKSKDDLEKRDEGYAQFSFNLLVSDRIGYRREIPDTRDQL